MSISHILRWVWWLRTANHFILSAFIVLTGDTNLCIITITCMKVIWNGNCYRYIGTLIGNPMGSDCFIKNWLKVKVFPMVPECTLNGKTIPYLACWLQSWNITSDILIDSPTIINHYKVMDISPGWPSLVLFHEHGSLWTFWPRLFY